MISAVKPAGPRRSPGRQAAVTTLCCGILTSVVSRVTIFFSSADLGKPSWLRELLPVVLTFGLIAAAVGAVWLTISYVLEFFGRAKPERVEVNRGSVTPSFAASLPTQRRNMGRVALQTVVLFSSGVALIVGSCFGFVGNHDILSPNEPLNAAARTFQYVMVLGLLAVSWAILSLLIEVLLWISQKRS